MKSLSKTKRMVTAGLLTALAIVIPMFSVQIIIPPFSATLGAHVPIMIAMFIDPYIAVLVALGSAAGFLLRGMNMVIVARAATHIFFAYAGAKMIQKNCNIYAVIAVTMLLHALGEALVVVPFGWPLFIPGNPLWKQAGIFVGLGTMIHHCIDFAVTLVVYEALYRAKVFKTPVKYKPAIAVRN